MIQEKDKLTIPDIIILLEKLKNKWSKHSVIKNDDINYDDIDFKQEIPDFLDSLLPFSSHPLYKNVDNNIKSKTLSCGWLIYNEKTINIETKVISPACVDIIDGKFSSLFTSDIREVIGQVLTDEAYHTLMAIKANALTMEKRNLNFIKIPNFELITKMTHIKETLDEDDKLLLSLACAIVSEMSISDYLRLLSNEYHIQKINQVVTNLHRKDEMSHSSIFKLILQIISQNLSETDIKKLIKFMNQAYTWFSSDEFDVWYSVLNQIHFPNYDKMIKECRKEKSIHRNSEISWDYTDIDSIISKL